MNADKRRYSVHPHRRSSAFIGGFLSCLFILAARAPAATPITAFHPGELWPDDHATPINAHGGGILFHDGTYYWFGEHKTEGTAGNKAQVGVHVYSSTDLLNWTDRGIALPVTNEKSDLQKDCILERPKVLFCPATHKFVMWFHLERKGAGYHDARSGVAVSDSPTGPYTFLYSLRPNAGAWPLDTPPELQKPLSKEEAASLAPLKLPGGPVKGQTFPADLIFRRDFATGQMARDMTLFLDDDQSAYHIYSSEDNGTLQISKLTPDFLKPAGQYARVLIGDFNEAPTLVKHNGKYYLITSGTSGWSPNAARLAVADNIFGPYKPLGNPCRGTDAQNKTTFESQATFILPIEGKKDAFIFMADRWRPKNAIDGRYIWLPIQWEKDQPALYWHESWDLSAFDK